MGRLDAKKTLVRVATHTASKATLEMFNRVLTIHIRRCDKIRFTNQVQGGRSRGQQLNTVWCRSF